MSNFLTKIRNTIVPARTVDYKQAPNKAAQTLALKGALKFSAPKTQNDITQGRSNATDVSKLAAGTVIK